MMSPSMMSCACKNEPLLGPPRHRNKNRHPLLYGLYTRGHAKGTQTSLLKCATVYLQEKLASGCSNCTLFMAHYNEPRAMVVSLRVHCCASCCREKSSGSGRLCFRLLATVGATLSSATKNARAYS